VTYSHVSILLVRYLLSPSICLSVVCNAHAPYPGGSNFWQYLNFYGIGYLGHLLTKKANSIMLAGWKLVAERFEAGLKLVADRFEAKFHYTIWFKAGCRQVGSWSWSPTSFEPACDQLRTR